MARGTITPRKSTDGKRTSYRVRWETRGPDGQRKHVSKTVRTKKEAEALLAEMQQAINTGTYIDPSKETVAQYLERWLDAMSPAWSESTLHLYRIVVRHRIVPELGHVPLAQLDARQVQTYYSNITTRYAPATVRITHAVLDAALARAVMWHLIPRNPTDNAILPAIPRATPLVWSAEECALFLTDARDNRHYALWQLALDSGMRIGELLALRWRDCSLDSKPPTVSVQRTLTKALSGAPKVGEKPKTHASHRSIVIGADSVAALRAHRSKQAERRLRLGPAWHNDDLVFDRGDGRLLNVTVVADGLKREIARHKGLPPITMHGMRHTMATLALAAGINPKIVQERLGHASIEMTLDRYSHVTLSMQEDAAQLLNALLQDSARPKRGQDAG